MYVISKICDPSPVFVIDKLRDVPYPSLIS